MKIRYLLIITLIVISNPGCHKLHERSSTSFTGKGETLQIKYARGFSIQMMDNFILMHVFNPWQGLKERQLIYLLCKDGSTVPDTLNYDVLVKTPVKRVVCMSTTHISMIREIDEIESVVGVSGANFINDSVVRNRIQKGLIQDIGYGQSIDYEMILSLKPDLFIMYGVSGEVTGIMNRLVSLGIPVILDAEYLERDPLAKAEWIYFIAGFYEKLDVAEQKFTMIESAYLNLKNLTRNLEEKPDVLTGLPWKNTWWVAGGDSYASRLISDAGGCYIWEDDTSHEAIPLDIEVVFSLAGDADIWINSGASESLQEILMVDERLQYFRAFRDKRVFNNNARINEWGGNDYWESGVMYPHLILKDLIRIFHPGLIPGGELVYYKKLE